MDYRQARPLAVPVTALVALSVTFAAQAKDMLGGGSVPDGFVMRNHPAEKDVMPTSPALYQYGGAGALGFHCYFIKPDGRVGNISLASLGLVYENRFPVSVLGGAITAEALRKTPQNYAPPDQAMYGYALRLAGGDPERARKIIRAAEASDANCYRRLIRQNLSDIKLAKQQLTLNIGTDFKGFVSRITPQGVPKMISNAVKMLRIAEQQIALHEAGYQLLYEGLDGLAGREPASVSPPATTSQPLGAHVARAPARRAQPGTERAPPARPKSPSATLPPPDAAGAPVPASPPASSTASTPPLPQAAPAAPEPTASARRAQQQTQQQQTLLQQSPPVPQKQAAQMPSSSLPQVRGSSTTVVAPATRSETPDGAVIRKAHIEMRQAILAVERGMESCVFRGRCE